jgi:hypothetical protein
VHDNDEERTKRLFARSEHDDDETEAVDDIGEESEDQTV